MVSCLAVLKQARGATFCNATLPYCREIADDGLDAFVRRSPGRAAAVNMRDGKLVCRAVSEVFPDMPV